MRSFFPSLEIINAVTPDPSIFLRIAPSVAGTAAVNPNGIKMVKSTFSIKAKPVFRNGLESLP